MRINERVLLVGSGKFGFGISDPMDCNVYLVDGGGQYAMIDAGGGCDPERIIGNIAKAGVPMDRVTHLLLTHAHGDHAAGAHYFHSRHGMKVVAAKEATPWLERADMDKTSLNAAKKAGVYPADFAFPECPIHFPVEEGDTIRIGELELRAIETPGHSRGHVSYLLEEGGRRSLFAGDVIFAGGRIVLQHIWDCSIRDYADSLDKLSRLRIDSLYPGHAAFVESGGRLGIESADAAFKRLEIPPNL